MNNRKKLEKYYPLIDFWGEVCGPDYEIVLHDVSTPDQSVLRIINNHISSRGEGSPLTDLAINLIQTKEYETKNFVTNYLGKTKAGKHLISSTYFIKEGNELIGLICVNHDTHVIQDIYEKLGSFLSTLSIDIASDKPVYQEHFDDNINERMYEIVETELAHSSITPDRMKSNEKKDFVKSLYVNGVFSVRGMVPFVAEKLLISEPSVYRYLKEIKK